MPATITRQNSTPVPVATFLRRQPTRTATPAPIAAIACAKDSERALIETEYDVSPDEVDGHPVPPVLIRSPAKSEPEPFRVRPTQRRRSGCSGIPTYNLGSRDAPANRTRHDDSDPAGERLATRRSKAVELASPPFMRQGTTKGVSRRALEARHSSTGSPWRSNGPTGASAALMPPAASQPADRCLSPVPRARSRPLPARPTPPAAGSRSR
jgi:hypothetical protein